MRAKGTSCVYRGQGQTLNESVHQITPSAHPSMDTSPPPSHHLLQIHSLVNMSLAVLCLPRCALVHLCTSFDLLLQGTWHPWSGMCGSGVAPVSTLEPGHDLWTCTEAENEWRGPNINRMGWRHRETSFSPSLSRFISPFLSGCVCAYCLLQQFHNPRLAGPPVRQAVLLRSTHTWTAAVQQQERASSAFTCRSCLQPPWGWILLSSLITVAQAEINLQHSITLGFVYEMVLQEQIHWGVYLKVFYFGQWSADQTVRGRSCGFILPPSGRYADYHGTAC